MNIIRLTLFSLISSIEQDLREVIDLNIHCRPKEILSAEQFEKYYSRLSKDTIISRDDVLIKDIVEYFDFDENIKIILQSKNKIDYYLFNYFKANIEVLEKIIPIRNRIAHSRPVKYDDHIIVYSVIETLLNTNDNNIWNNLTDTFLKLKKDPNYAMQFEISDSFQKDETIFNNLPLPDFDETGFIGRDRLVQTINRTVLGSYPVITLLGDGGLGKTALALKAAYDIIEDPDTAFEAVIWTSSKTTQLTPYEIVKIDNAISNSLGVILDINESLGGVNNSEEQALNNILEYLSEFKILLIIDNLETVLDDRIRNFLGQIPIGSKVLITSRIGLGAYEYPIRVEPMDNKEAIFLLRRLAEIRGIKDLKKIHDNKLSVYLKKMNHNPGYIKWFISAIQVGLRPEEVLANPDIFLDFCMSNVYNFLNDMNKKVLRSLLCLSTELSHAELAYINELDYKSLQQNLQQLLSSNMIIMNSIAHGSSFETKYCITEFARDYLTKKHPIRNEEYRDFKKIHNRLISDNESITNAISSTNQYSIYHIHLRSGSDKIIAKYLIDAMTSAKTKNYTRASDLIQKAQDLAPDYFEVYRCKGWIKAAQGFVSIADTAYQTALELEPKYAPLLYYYGGFALRGLNNLELSKEYLEKAYELDSTNHQTIIELSRVSIFLGLYDEADRLLTNLIKSKSISLFEQKVIWDLSIQINYRKADGYFNNSNFPQAISVLKIAQNLYYDCPPKLRDDQMKKSFRKAEFFLNNILCKIEQTESDYSSLSEELLSVIKINNQIIYKEEDNKISINNSESGSIYKLFREKNFGFILSEDGETIFFHKSNFFKVNDWYRIRPNKKVAFNLFIGDTGKSNATDIIII